MLKDTITASEIDVLRQLGDGWRDIWHRVLQILLGDGTNGPLYRQAKSVCLRSPENSRRLAALREDEESDDGVKDEKSPDGVKDEKSPDEVEDEEYSDGGVFSRVAYLVSPDELVSYIYEYYDRR